MPDSVIQRSFGAGELAPVNHARADQVKYATGLRTCRNFFIRREGGASNRSGFGFVQACKTNTAGTKIRPYVGANANESFAVEMGQGYFRFFTPAGAPVEVSGVPAYSGVTAYVPGDLVSSAGVNYYCVANTTGNAPPNASFWYPLTGDTYEIPTPYALGALPEWTQSGNVVVLTQQGQQPRELVFTSATRWVLRLITTTPTVAAPAGLNATAGAVGGLTYSYVVTAAAGGSFEESNASAADSVLCVEPTKTAPNTLTWTAVAGAEEYYVYCDPYGNGVYGFIGTAATNAFNDTGFVPDFNTTPPQAQALFQTSSNFPKACAHYQQRRFFANTLNDPDSIWGSRTGFLSNFGISSPLQDDDSVSFRLAGNNHHAIQHMRALKSGLVLLTGGGEWTITSGDGPKRPITPSSIHGDQETYVGCSTAVRPVVVGNTVIYAQARNSVIRELAFDQNVEGLAGRDLSVWSSHLFRRKQLLAMDYQQVPESIVWCVRSDGVLLGMTYMPEEDLVGWHRHDTDGAFEDCCVVPGDEEDVLFVIVSREIGGSTKRYVELLERRDTLDGFVQSGSIFVDSALTYGGPPADQFSGLEHLNGKLVSVYGDGDVVFDANTESPTAAQLARFTVVAGVIELEASYRNVHIGLPIVADLETLSLDANGSAVRDKKKRVASVSLLVERSARSFAAGPDEDHLREYTPQSWEATDDVNDDQLELSLTSQFDKDGRVLVRQTKPLPLTVLGIIPNIEMGG